MTTRALCAILYTERGEDTQTNRKGHRTMIMNKIDAFAFFEEIFDEVMKELALAGWWELFDSEQFEEVEWRIAEALEAEDIEQVEWFDEWVREMADEL